MGRLSKSALRRSCSGIAGHHAHRVLHDPFGDDGHEEGSDEDQHSEDDEVQQVNDLILTDETNSWHAERGSDRFVHRIYARVCVCVCRVCCVINGSRWAGSDFVMGAFPALEDDLHYTLMYKKYFYEKGM